MVSCHCRVTFFLLVLPILVISTLVNVAGAQGIAQLPGQSGLLIPPTFIGGAASPQSYFSLGNLGAGCGDSGLPYLGNFSAGYNYNSCFQGGVSFNELRLIYALPLLTEDGDLVRPFIIAYITDLKNSPRAFGLADALLRFGGSWSTRLGQGWWVGARGEYDATRRRGTWHSGGRAALEMFQFVGRDIATLRVTYQAESAGDQLIFLKNPTGYEVAVWYSHDLFYGGPRLMLKASGYDFDTGSSKQRGWNMGASLSMSGGLFTLKGTAGHDSVMLDNYSVGAFCTLAF